ncbi:MAG: hypothetical protein QOJ29_1342 [Thermoleophilaceae bacterium]|jgi:hypothetical protein|nr:hypothetical protein [Thermoleophilaceae bacterium]
MLATELGQRVHRERSQTVEPHHDHARSRAYRWSDDGLGGICDEQQTLCLAFAFWNAPGPFLKERVFGLDGHKGNHGEDAKEYWWYLDSTPTHSAGMRSP